MIDDDHLSTVQRPYACKIAGTPVHSEFDLDSVCYTFSFLPFTAQERQVQKEQKGYEALDKMAYTTELFVPFFHFGGKELKIEATSGECVYDEDRQTLYHTYDDQINSNITITLSVLNHTVPQGHCSIM